MNKDIIVNNSFQYFRKTRKYWYRKAITHSCIIPFLKYLNIGVTLAILSCEGRMPFSKESSKINDEA